MGTTTRAEQVVAVLAPLLRDVAAAGLPVPRLEIGTSSGEEIVWVRLPSGSGVGVWLGPEDETDAERRLRATDLAHEAIVEDLPAQGRPTNWPVCPDHPDTHPMAVRAHGDELWWECPRGGSARVRVGELGAAGAL